MQFCTASRPYDRNAVVTVQLASGAILAVTFTDTGDGVEIGTPRKIAELASHPIDGIETGGFIGN